MARKFTLDVRAELCLLQLSILVLLVADTAVSTDSGRWICSITGFGGTVSRWQCIISENCCLTGRNLESTGCCNEITTEQVFSQRPNYQACTPAHRQTYYCPSNRDCCVVATAGGRNKTGCCISQLSSPEGSTPTSNSSKTTGTSKVTIVVIVVLTVIVVLGGLIGFAVSTQRRQPRAGRYRMARDRDNADAGDNEGQSFLPPPSYWESPDGADATPANSSRRDGESPVPTVVTLDATSAEPLVRVGPAHVQLGGDRPLPEYTETPKANERVVSFAVNPKQGFGDDEEAAVGNAASLGDWLVEENKPVTDSSASNSAADGEADINTSPTVGLLASAL